MAEVAVLCGWYMVHRRIFAGGVHTVMTAFAGNGNTLVIKRTGGKTVGVMADPAVLGSGDMIYRFTHGGSTIMA